MKRITALLILLSLLILTACEQKKSPEDILYEFMTEYPISANIYSSLCDEADAGYISEEMLAAVFGTSEPPTAEFALILYGKVDKVIEVGVFDVGGGDGIGLTELITRRISFLSSFAEGEGFIKKYRGVLVYGFVRDAAYAEEIFDRIL